MIELRAGRRVRAIEMDVPPRQCVPRGARQYETGMVQEHLNMKLAYQKFELSLYANFTVLDWLIELTYDDAHLPQRYEDANRKLKRFIRRLRMARRERGKELRYLYVTEGLHGDGRMHHHIIVNFGTETLKELAELWGQGFVFRQRLADFRGENNQEGLSAVAKYLTKEPRKTGKLRVGQRMWTGSIGLEKPVRREWELLPGEHYLPPEGAKPFPGSRFPERRENVYGSFAAYDFEVRDAGKTELSP